MSKGKVFIGWCSDNSLAHAVKSKLYYAGYEGVVGGKNGNSLIAHAVGQTVIDQMDECCSAIMLFSKKDNHLSSNMLYELGYLSGALRSNCILTVYLDVSNDIIPSDLLGIWATRIDDLSLSDDEIAQKIVNQFVEEQNIENSTDRLDLISQYSELKSRIINHKKPVYYNDEMAEFILLFSHSAYIYNDFENAGMVLNKAQSDYSDSIEISIASICALNYFNIHFNIEKNNFGTAVLSKNEYEKIKYSYIECIESVDELVINSESFKQFFKMMCYNYLDFANVMYFLGLKKSEVTKDFLDFAEECYQQGIKYCNELLCSNEKANRHLVSLIIAYLNRTKAFICKETGSELCCEFFEKSISERKKLYSNYKFNQSIDKVFVSQMELEYFLALSDNINMIENASVREKRVFEIKKFLAKEERNFFNRRYNIEIMNSSIKELDL